MLSNKTIIPILQMQELCMLLKIRRLTKIYHVSMIFDSPDFTRFHNFHGV
jgi:hypothetical protein